MKRLSTIQLNQWFNSKSRKPLILRGARQVGKSTLVRLFAEEMGFDLIEINLEKKKFQTLKAESFDIQYWISEIEAISKKKIQKRTLVFLDEIQTQPKAISFLRYFYEEAPDIAIITAGSLLDIVLSQETISFPVGRVEFLWIGPMSFGEFLIADGNEALFNLMMEGKLKEHHHSILLEQLKKYYFIGGMPKAVKTYLETKSFLEVRKAQEEIVQTYYDDFPKYGKRLNTDRVGKIFREVSFKLGGKTIYQQLDSESKSSEIKKCVELLIQANVLIPVYHTQANGVPLKGQIDSKIFRLFFLDIGLVNSIHEFSWNGFEKLFFDSFSSKGFLAEQFAAQHLAYGLNDRVRPELLYWLRDKDIQKAEIDFLVQKNQTIYPIEIKAGKGGKLKSLKLFAEEKECAVAYKLSQSWFETETLTLTDKTELKVHSVPLYAIEALIQSTLTSNY